MHYACSVIKHRKHPLDYTKLQFAALLFSQNHRKRKGKEEREGRMKGKAERERVFDSEREQLRNALG